MLEAQASSASQLTVEAKCGRSARIAAAYRPLSKAPRPSDRRQRYALDSTPPGEFNTTTDAAHVNEVQAFLALFTLECLFVAHFLLRETSLEELSARLPGWLWTISLAVMLSAIFLTPGEDRAFVYFQF